jgi:hypothetical protein
MEDRAVNPKMSPAPAAFTQRVAGFARGPRRA